MNSSDLDGKAKAGKKGPKAASKREKGTKEVIG